MWSQDDPAFGGFSGLEVTADGTSLYALSDRGHLATGTIHREGGRIVDITLDDIVRLRGRARVPLRRAESDSEGLALGPNGDIFISFEWTHGVRGLVSDIGETGPLLMAPAFEGLQDNASLEALAISSDGALYTIPERSGSATRPRASLRATKVATSWAQL